MSDFVKTETTYYKFNQHKKCEFFPCHQGIKEENFNCLFCYCPLYALGRDCGGNFSYDNAAGIKDCSNCLIPHQKNSYDYMMKKTALLIEMVREKKEDEESK